jgi:hypothetical protein
MYMYMPEFGNQEASDNHTDTPENHTGNDATCSSPADHGQAATSSQSKGSILLGQDINLQEEIC